MTWTALSLGYISNDLFQCTLSIKLLRYVSEIELNAVLVADIPTGNVEQIIFQIFDLKYKMSVGIIFVCIHAVNNYEK